MLVRTADVFFRGTCESRAGVPRTVSVLSATRRQREVGKRDARSLFPQVRACARVWCAAGLRSACLRVLAALVSMSRNLLVRHGEVRALDGPAPVSSQAPRREGKRGEERARRRRGRRKRLEGAGTGGGRARGLAQAGAHRRARTRGGVCAFCQGVLSVRALSVSARRAGARRKSRPERGGGASVARSPPPPPGAVHFSFLSLLSSILSRLFPRAAPCGGRGGSRWHQKRRSALVVGGCAHINEDIKSL